VFQKVGMPNENFYRFAKIVTIFTVITQNVWSIINFHCSRVWCICAHPTMTYRVGQKTSWTLRNYYCAHTLWRVISFYAFVDQYILTYWFTNAQKKLLSIKIVHSNSYAKFRMFLPHPVCHCGMCFYLHKSQTYAPNPSTSVQSSWHQPLQAWHWIHVSVGGFTKSSPQIRQ